MMGGAAYGVGEKNENVLAEDFDMTTQQLGYIVGPSALSNIIRIHRFAGTEKQLEKMKDHGLKGLLTAYDNRGSYDLTSGEEREVINAGFAVKNGLIYKHTDICLEKLNLKREEWDKCFEMDKRPAEIFTHEFLWPQTKSLIGL